MIEIRGYRERISGILKRIHDDVIVYALLGICWEQIGEFAEAPVAGK